MRPALVLSGALLVSCGHPSNVPGPAPRCPGGACDWAPVTRRLDEAVNAEHAAPGAVLAVSVAGARFVYGTGRLGEAAPARPGASTVYDLASLTKVVGLTTAAMLAVDAGRLELDQPVQHYVPAFQGAGKEVVTVRHLLTHSSGLPAWRALYREASTRAEAIALADSTPLDTVPGARAVYSDIGAIVLTQVVEAALGEPIDRALASRVFGPLGLEHTRYLPPASWCDRIAPTEHDPWRGRVLRGEVHDENAARLDGVSGHAGLFSTAEDMLRFAEWLLQSEAGDAPAPRLSSGVIREFTRAQNVVPGSSRALGWDTPSEGGSAGTRLSPGSFGHTGFTGTSIWLDPERRLAIVLLSNRVHPTRDNPRWGPVRAQIADLVVATLFPETR
jgi:serine-type D-Ala-D-Ala carboxypeptidase